MTGGNPKTTGVYYDDTYNHACLPAGHHRLRAARSPAPRSTYFEPRHDPLALDAGQGLPGLPGRDPADDRAIPRTLIDPAAAAGRPGDVQARVPAPVPEGEHDLRGRAAAGLRTAWSDKHPAYEILNGPSGTGIQDLFTPEINSDAPTRRLRRRLDDATTR